jgi:hypothetical protein
MMAQSWDAVEEDQNKNITQAVVGAACVLAEQGMPPTRLRVYAEIVRQAYADSRGQCYADVDELARAVGLSRSAVRLSLKDLRGSGLPLPLVQLPALHWKFRDDPSLERPRHGFVVGPSSYAISDDRGTATRS